MASLGNPAHEVFAYHLSRGMKQKKAYVMAGYTANESAASRLAKSPGVTDRVEELKQEVNKKINKAMSEPNEENFKSLADMGLTMEWCAHAYKTIYEEAITQGQLAPANTAVSNIQKLVEINGVGTGEEEASEESLIKVSEVTGMLDSLKGVIEATQGPDKNKDPAGDAVDITPDDEVCPTALIQQMDSDDDHTS